MNVMVDFKENDNATINATDSKITDVNFRDVTCENCNEYEKERNIKDFNYLKSELKKVFNDTNVDFKQKSNATTSKTAVENVPGVSAVNYKKYEKDRSIADIKHRECAKEKTIIDIHHNDSKKDAIGDFKDKSNATDSKTEIEKFHDGSAIEKEINKIDMNYTASKRVAEIDNRECERDATVLKDWKEERLRLEQKRIEREEEVSKQLMKILRLLEMKDQT
ncbi:hypothetical protein O0L34_g12002 [Tuta absoluta]|nr:hypothetical protein O0L34_g12002 [Tuta absoluta]